MKTGGAACLVRMAAAAAMVGAAGGARGQDLFGITVTDTGGGGVPTLDVRGSSLPDLLESLVDTSGQFATFNGTSLSANVLYAGVPNAIQVTVNNAGSVATLRFTVLGAGAQTFTFDEANGNLETQVTDFLLEDAPEVLTDFFKEINKRSLVGVTDGNPIASTSRATRYSFDRFVMLRRGDGRGAVELPPEGEGANSGLVLSQDEEGGSATILRIDASAGIISTDIGDGESASIATSLEFAFNPTISLVVAIPLSFHNIEGSFVGNVGFHVDAPITILKAAEHDGFYWVVTPGVLAHAAGSYDLASGGLLYGFGASTQVGWSGDGWHVYGGPQITILDSATVRYGDYEYNAGVDQQVLRVGGRVARDIDEAWYVYGGAAYTDLLEDAAVGDWITPGVGLGWRNEAGTVDLSFGYEGDFGDGYEVHQGVFAVAFEF